jgi:hypothetical protein
VDIVFVVDDTGSMENNIDGVKNNIRGFIQDIENESIDGRYALITFSQSPELDQGFTDDPAELEQALGRINAQGNLEDNFDALKMATEMEFRSDAKRVVVDITDEDADLAPVTDLRMPEVIEFMKPFDAYVAVSEDPPGNCASPPGPSCKDKRVLGQTLEGGQWVDLGQLDDDDESDFGDILETVKGVITDLVGDGGASGGDIVEADIEYVDATFNRTTIDPGGTVEVNVTAINRGEASGAYIAAFQSDFRLIDTQRGQLQPGESVRLSTEITFEDTGQHRIFAGRSYLGTVTVDALTAAETSERYLKVEYAYLTRLHAWKGTSFEVVATVRSTADTVDEFAITSKRFDGGGAVSETVFLEPRERRVIRQSHTITATPDRISLQEWQVNGARAGNLTVHPEGTDLPTGVLYTYVTKDEVEPGDRYDVVAVIHNGDDSRRNVLVNFARENGDGDGESMLRGLEPGDTERVTYDVIGDGSGTVRWVVNDDLRAGAVEIRESE